jgi:hypothetical protein
MNSQRQPNFINRFSSNPPNQYGGNGNGGQFKKSNNFIDYSNIQLKQQLINYIYSTVELSKFKYKLIEYESELGLLSKQKHYLSANFSGSNCLLVFTKIKDRFYSFMIDRKTLSYNPSQINLESIKIMSVNVRLDNSIYNGSIFDGILIQSERSKTFVITDIYYFRGKDLTNDQINHKMINIKSYIDANLKTDNKINNLELYVNKLYDLSEVETLLNVDIPKAKTHPIKGIAFYPATSGTKLIYLFQNDSKIITPSNSANSMTTNSFKNTFAGKLFSDTTTTGSKHHLYASSSNFVNHNNTNMYKENKDTQMTNHFNTNHHSSNSVTQANSEQVNDTKKKKVGYKYVPKTDKPVVATFDMRKTETTDVYKLYVVEKEMNDDKSKPVLRSKKMGIAYIPSIDSSQNCKNIMISHPNGKALVKCVFRHDKNKWEPIEEDKVRKFPSLLTDIEDMMEIFEESCSDED